MNKFKRIISIILLTMMLLSSNTIIVLAETTLPGSNPTGPGNLGPYSAPAVFVKADFYKPSSYGLTNLNYIDKPKMTPGLPGVGPFKSLGDRTIFERGTIRPTMQPLKPGVGGTDSKELGQMYAYVGEGYKPMSFLVEKDTYSTFDSTGHKYIGSRKMSGVTETAYKNANGILSVSNEYMKELLKATNNGKDWGDGESIVKALDKLWAGYVNPASGNFSSSSAGVRYRQEFTSMYNSVNGNSVLAPAMAYVNTVYETHLAVGSTPPGANFKVETKQQKANLQNLMTACLGLVLSNPAGGTNISPEGIISASESYKGDTILKGMSNWARSGGNSDSSDNHFAIRLDVYASRGLPTGKNQFDRWDMALYNATINSDKFMMSVPANVPLGKANPDYYGFDGVYSLANADKYFRQHMTSILDGHRIEKNMYPKKNPKDSKSTGWNWMSMFTIFQEVYLNASGAITNSNSTSKYNYRGILEFKTPGYFENKRTLNLGFGYIAPSGENKGPDGETAKPNFLMDSTVFTDEQMVAKDSKASATSFTGFKAMPAPTEAVVKQYGLKIPEFSWNNRNDELNNMLKLIERSMDSSQIASGSENSKLPVTLTIKRTIVNGKGNTDGKMIDDPWTAATEIQTCGQHNFKIVDNGDTATITFNMVPSSGKCNYETHKILSPIKTADGKTGQDSVTEIDSCAYASLFYDASSRIKFNDTDIDITDSSGGVTTVNYDYSYTIKTPVFKVNEKVYGTADKDTMLNQANYVGLGYVVYPEKGAVYPNSDWKSGFVRSEVIRRSVSFTRAADTPFYTNLGYEKKTPYYSEIKQGTPTNEQFEAMSGTPTTRDLYMSVSGSDFRVDFNASAAAKSNPSGFRKYTYTVNVNNCWEANPACSGTCPGILYGPPPTDAEGNVTGPPPVTHPKHSPLACGIDSCQSHPTNEYHPDSHTWVYNVHAPIEAFTYFDMEDSEVWRLVEWGLNGGESFLTKPNPKWEMGTQFWGLNQQNYSSKNGRLVFSEAMNSNTDGGLEKYGDNSRSFTVSDNLRTALKEEALGLVNGAKNGEKSFTGSIISDYIVLKTSEGYQVPYFFEQPFDTTATPSSAPDFTGEGGTATTTDTIKVNKQLTMDDLWWKNSNKAHTASRENGWTNSSITYAGYNGDYKNLGTKYNNSDHTPFISSDNPLEKMLQKYKLSLSQAYPSQLKDGSGTTTFGKNAGNKEHIKTGLDVVDTTPNGEYDTGKSWLKYNRVMFYQKNSNAGATSGTAGKFSMTGAGVYLNNNVPYYDEAPKVNDITIHNPVSAQNAVVITNDKKYDDRTNAALLQGGDPIGLMGGVCPVIGCEYSELICTTPLEPHKDSCYSQVTDKTMHVGGNNSHVHTASCTHKHTAACYPVQTGYYYHNDAGCSYEGQKHPSTSTTECSQCGHSCGYYVSGGGGGGGCNCYHCADPRCSNYCNGCGVSNNTPCSSTCETVNPPKAICGILEGTCNKVPNTHVCQSCTFTFKKVLSCSNPHHYLPGEPTDRENAKYHYPVGDAKCWKRCGDDSRHGEPDNIKLPDGSPAQMGGVFINIDREFKIYYPFTGDFAEDPGLEGIGETTVVRGKGYYNNMYTDEWTSHRWVSFPVNVIDPKGEMILATSQIDLNEYSTTEEEFTFYAVLANNEMSSGDVKFTSTAINLPGVSHEEYFDESVGITNKERVDWKYAARHTAAKHQYIDVVGYIGAMGLHDTGDFRFSNLFKQPKGDGSWLIPNLVPEVNLDRPNFILGDGITVRRDLSTEGTSWLDTYGHMFNTEGGKSGGEGNVKQPLILPLVPKYNTIPSLRNQPMRPGYQLYMDTETVGNYYGETSDENTGKLLDSQMQAKMQIIPKYYSLDLKTGVYTPVDVYYGINGEYMQVNDYDFGNIDVDDVGVQDYYYYLDWLEESARRNYTTGEQSITNAVKQYRAIKEYGSSDFKLRSPNAQKDVIGSANVLFLNDLNRTFTGSSLTYGKDNNPGKKLVEEYFNQQSQRWHFTVGLPSSSVFVESNKECTEHNITSLQSKDRVVVCSLDIKVQGDVWTLQYDGTYINSGGFQVYEGGMTYQPPKFDKDGKPTTDPTKDVTSEDPVIVIYPSDKTSKDDIKTNGIQ